jgi:hypothetical protein
VEGQPVEKGKRYRSERRRKERKRRRSVGLGKFGASPFLIEGAKKRKSRAGEKGRDYYSRLPHSFNLPTTFFEYPILNAR